jgi:NAD(P)-dependent dehydrogenase (short-subunit alcohol dehydrogenase family)
VGSTTPNTWHYGFAMPPGTLPHSPVILVTGATDGIGRETAVTLARLGARVIAHGRRPERLTAVHDELERASRTSQPAPAEADLSSLAEVRRLAADLSERDLGIDVVVNNAGVFMNDQRLTADGVETTMAVNHFAPFLLTHALLAGRHGAALRRVVNVSSMAHQSGRIDPEDAALTRRPFDGYDAYAASKLANVLFTVELPRRLGTHAPTVNALHPGVVTTKLLREGFSMKGGDSLEEGAKTSVFLATDPSVAGVTGRYFVRCREANPHRAAADAALCRRFYDETARIAGMAPPGR